MKVKDNGVLTDDNGNVKMCPFQNVLPFKDKLSLGKNLSFTHQIPCADSCVLFAYIKDKDGNLFIRLHCGSGRQMPFVEEIKKGKISKLKPI